MAPLPAFPDLDRRWVMRVPVDPYLRLDTNDYSPKPRTGGSARRDSHQPERGEGGLSGHGRARVPPPALVRAAPLDHHDRARCARSERCAVGWPSRSSSSGRWTPMTR